MLLKKLKGEKWQTVRLEEWRENECYHISTLGRVLSEKHYKKKLRFKLTNINGYYAFSAIRKNKKTHLVYMHKIIAELFLENELNKPYVIHLDYNKTNNNIENLAWATKGEMFSHNRNNPLVIAGKEKRELKKTYAKLSVGKVKMIKRKLFNTKSKTRMRLIAKQFGISEMQLYRIKSGKNWASVTDF